MINMPFSDIRIPSIALAQLKTVTQEQFPGIVSIQEHFFNLEMAEYVSPEVYEFISNSGTSNDTGFGDWFFRQEAFPDLPDNEAEFFERYGLHFSQEMRYVYDEVLSHKRKELGEFLEDLIRKFGLDTYDMVGFTTMFMQNVPSFALARKIKEVNPNCLILMGGANCESPMGEEIIRHISWVDYVFSGTTLKSFPLFLNAVLEGDMDKTHVINGVFSKKNCLPPVSGQEMMNLKPIGPVGEERPLDEVVDLDYDDFLTVYEEKFAGVWKSPYILFETSRGCWWGAKSHCTFCGLNGGNMFYRAISPPKAINYFNSLFEKYSKRVNHFSCVDNIIPKEYFTEVFPAIKVPENISMFYEVKADLTEEQMQILSNSQVLEIQPGIEALSTSTLKLMRKGTSAFGNIRLLKYCVTYGIAPAWNLLIGFPGEQEDVFAKYFHDLPLLYHLPPPNGVFPVRFDRYSPYFTRALEYNLNLKPLDYYKMVYPYSDEALFRMAYYFADQNYDAEYIQAVSRWIDKLRPLVDDWNERWRSSENSLSRPRLFVEEESDGGMLVFDSRGETVRRYPLSAVGKAILDCMHIHRSKSSILAELAEVPADQVEEELDYLMSKGLIFEERGSMMSLVFNSDVQNFRIESYHTADIYRSEDEFAA